MGGHLSVNLGMLIAVLCVIIALFVIYLYGRKVEANIIYVPIFNSDKRSYAEKWMDEEYLKSVTELGVNMVFREELVQALKEIRNCSDKAITPDELKGCSYGVKIIKGLLTKPEVARNLIAQIKEIENANSPNG